MPITPLLSWDMIYPGACQWTNARQPVECDVPRGVELRVEPATKSEPILVAERPWERGGLSGSQVLSDGGRYRMWYSARPEEGVHALCYAESDDGARWRKPELGIINWSGSAANNLVHAGPEAASACVLKDPTADDDARYKAMSFSAWFEGERGEILDSDEGHRRLDAQNAAGPGERVPPVRIEGKMRGMISPDGLHWTPIRGPILEEWHDTHNICVWCPTRGSYVAYLRGFYAGRRAISYSETDEFSSWPASRIVHALSPGDEPDLSLYSNCYTAYPGAPGVHLMFPALYHQGADTVDVQLAVSLDGAHWSRHSGRPVIPHGQPGEPDGGFVYAEPELIRFPSEGKLRLLCHTGARYHNEWYNEELRKQGLESHYRWAQWPEDRLAGIHAPAEGQFTMTLQACGERMLANFRTEPGGWVRFELTDRLVWPPLQLPGLPGRCFEQAEPLSGDHTRREVAWRAGADLSDLRGRDVAVRVRLYKATLYAVTMLGASAPSRRRDPRFPV